MRDILCTNCVYMVVEERNNGITYNVFEGGRVGAANEMRIKRYHN